MQVLYERALVVADVISAHCHGTCAREDFVRACVSGEWNDAKAMVEGMLAEPWHFDRPPGTPAARVSRDPAVEGRHSRAPVMRAWEDDRISRCNRLPNIVLSLRADACGPHCRRVDERVHPAWFRPLDRSLFAGRFDGDAWRRTASRLSDHEMAPG